MSALERLRTKIDNLIRNYELLKLENSKLKKRLDNPSFDAKEQQNTINRLKEDLDYKDKVIDQLIQKVEEFLETNQKTNAEETLFNAEELARLTQELKDSIRIETFQTPDYKIRLNVINNEALRLKDMSSIPNLSANEVLNEYQKVFEAFNALNSKLNNNVSKEKINKELKDFIDEIATDSVEMDTVKYEEFK